MRYSHIFGPVRSRRLGISLGVDLVPAKTCTLECVYCECGATTRLTTQRREYIPPTAITTELSDYLDRKPQLDYVTLGGSGEPTLNTAFTPIVHFLKRNYPDYRLALLTNATLLTDPDVIEGAISCDVVLPSLDAVSEEVFQKLNKGHSSLSAAQMIEGLISFSRLYQGQIWLEIFIVPGLNDTPDELDLLRDTAMRMRTDRVQLNSLDRPGVRPDLKPASRERLREIARFFRPLRTEIIARNRAPKPTDIPSATHARERILATLSRRPCTAQELSGISGLTPEETASLLKSLVDSRQIRTEEVDGVCFYIRT